MYSQNQILVIRALNFPFQRLQKSSLDLNRSFQGKRLQITTLMEIANRQFWTKVSKNFHEKSFCLHSWAVLVHIISHARSFTQIILFEQSYRETILSIEALMDDFWPVNLNKKRPLEIRNSQIEITFFSTLVIVWNEKQSA